MYQFFVIVDYFIIVDYFVKVHYLKTKGKTMTKKIYVPYSSFESICDRLQWFGLGAVFTFIFFC